MLKHTKLAGCSGKSREQALHSSYLYQWARAELRRGRTARSSAMPPYPCSTAAKEVTPRKRTSRRSSGRVGLAGDAVERPEKLAETRRSSPRRRQSEIGGAERVEFASEASTRCVASCGWRRGWQEGPATAYGRHLARHAAADGDCPNWISFWIGRLQWLKLQLHRRFILSSLDGFGSELILWIELHEFYNFDYTSSV